MDPTDILLSEGQDLAAALECQEQLFQILQNIVTQLPAATTPPPISMGNSGLHLPMPPQ